MRVLLDRRAFWVGLGALGAPLAACAQARETAGLDGAWGGALNGVTAQVIIVGASVIGFYWRDDYVEAGHATLTRTSESTATLEVSEGTSLVRLNLRRD